MTSRIFFERDFLLFDREINELNGKKMNIFTPKEVLSDSFGHVLFLLISDFWVKIFTDYRFLDLKFTKFY